MADNWITRSDNWITRADNWTTRSDKVAPVQVHLQYLHQEKLIRHFQDNLKLVYIFMP